MASAARRGRKGPKPPKMAIQGKISPERFHYCPEHDLKVKARKTFGAGMYFECKEGCYIPKGRTVLK